MTVRLKLRRICVVEVVSDETERLEVTVKDLRSMVKCPWCGFKTTKVHDVRRVRISDLPVLGMVIIRARGRGREGPTTSQAQARAS